MPKIILITHQKGGVGKSTLTFNLAQNIAANSKVAVLDFDLQGSLSQLKELVTDFEIITYQDKLENISELDYDFIFIDTPPYLSNHLPKLISLVDLIIVPTKAGILDLLAIKSTLAIIEQEQRIEDTLVVFNMIKPNTTLTLDILIGLEEYNVKIANTHISDLVSFTRSVLLKGVTNDKNAQKQIDQLTTEILLRLI
ncbi:chromosome partitioning protein [Flavobacterium fryxellicola]|uniref:Conjugal transfer protein TraA n=1 Tax=Flavobacterium fryxellicola TaxID=249352 RepID=A0A167W198_9FLAO|nr:ParA family protein [Flavobacterium fryxellicola]OAB26921.1 conjugal transfer protein TraA [Flavobacterium fryxellicola]SHN79867.1 chromosome partitioning protein [Flavobacterium fryxellicola]